MTAKAISAGTAEMIGARMNTARSAPFGMMSSLRASLMPSARDWRMPKGPTRFGPTRICMNATIRRSAQIRSSTVTTRKMKTTSALMSTNHHGSAPKTDSSDGGGVSWVSNMAPAWVRTARVMWHRRRRDGGGATRSRGTSSSQTDQRTRVCGQIPPHLGFAGIRREPDDTVRHLGDLERQGDLASVVADSYVLALSCSDRGGGSFGQPDDRLLGGGGEMRLAGLQPSIVEQQPPGRQDRLAVCWARRQAG